MAIDEVKRVPEPNAETAVVVDAPGMPDANGPEGADAAPEAAVPECDEADAEVDAAVCLRRGDQWVLAVLVLVALVLMIAHWARLSGWGMQAVEIERVPDREYEYRLNINTATWVEWMQIEAIGETLARRIVDDRDVNGPFSSVDDLRRVKGIGAKTLEKIRPTLTVGPPSTR